MNYKRDDKRKIGWSWTFFGTFCMLKHAETYNICPTTTKTCHRQDRIDVRLERASGSPQDFQVTQRIAKKLQIAANCCKLHLRQNDLHIFVAHLKII